MVKALFPIGKTQWAKWSDAQRTAFNEAREAGVPGAEAVQAANQTVATEKKSVAPAAINVINAEPIELEPTERLDEVVAVISTGKKPRAPSKKGK